jgi:hypothetical protein
LIRVPYGAEWLDWEPPEGTRVVRPPAPRAPIADVPAAVRAALAAPIGHEPLDRLVGPSSRVTIAVDDPAIPPVDTDPATLKGQIVSTVLEELSRLGVRPENVTVLIAIALHRKWTERELARTLGDDLVYRLGYRRLRHHDAEDPADQLHLGETERGMEVEVNRAVVESDQLIYVNVSWTPFNGGWKSVGVGLSTFRSIRYHHRPFPRASGKSVMDVRRSSFPKIMGEIGAVIERELANRGRRVLQIETVLNSAWPQQPCQILAGHPPDVHPRTVDTMLEQFTVDVDGQSDVLVAGLPAAHDPYSRYSTMNPIHVAHGANGFVLGMHQNGPLVRPGGILVVAHPCHGAIDADRHPSYVEMYERLLPGTLDPVELWERHVDDFAHRPEYVYKYRHAHAFHGSHPFFLWSQTGFLRRYLSDVFVAGARDPQAARRVGLTPFGSLDEALAEAAARLGRSHSLAYHHFPPLSLPRVHLPAPV